MVNEYTKELTAKNFKNNIILELKQMQEEYRKKGVPTILEDGLNELLLILSIKQPKTILELGTSMGCSGIAMLKTIKDATLFTVEKIPEVRKEALANFEKYGVKDRVTSLIGDSLDVVKNLTKKFDFIFLDCNKAAYATLYPLLKDLLNDGGVIFADNILLLFDASEEMLAIGSIALRTLSLGFMFAGISIILSGVFQATGKGNYSLIVFILRQLSINLPLLYLIGKYINVNLMWSAFVFSELLAMIVSIVFINKIKKQIYDN